MAVQFVRFCRWAVFAGVFAGALEGTTISFTGDLRADATVIGCGVGCTLDPGSSTDGEYAQFAAVVRNFSLANPSDVRAITFSYGGGTNGNGAIIAQGGFEPYFSLFDSAGNFLQSTFFGELCPAGSNSYLGACYDVALSMGTLPAGDYQLALSAYANLSFAENLGTGTLADGFTGLGSLYQGEDLHYAFDIVIGGDGGNPVPEPTGALMLGTALAAAVAARCRRST